MTNNCFNFAICGNKAKGRMKSQTGRLDLYLWTCDECKELARMMCQQVFEADLKNFEEERKK